MAVAYAKSTNLQADVESLGSVKGIFGTLTFTGSYATGGDSLDLLAAFLKSGRGILLSHREDIQGYAFRYDSTNKKLLVYSSAGTELAAGAYPAALTTGTHPFWAVGI